VTRKAAAGRIIFDPSSYYSSAVSADSERATRSIVRSASAEDSVSLGAAFSRLFGQIVRARALAEEPDWIASGAEPIHADAVQHAIALLIALPKTLPPPVITPEDTGEIGFEWYKDKHHVVSLTVDGSHVRWAALLGPDAEPSSGAEPFGRTIPLGALTAIERVAS
jgi:hypothetical protein